MRGYEETELFETVMFGYERKQVDDYIDAICDELNVLATEVKRLKPIEDESSEQAKEIARLRKELAGQAGVASVSERLRQALKLVEEEAAALRDEAQEILAKARAEADTTVKAAREDSELLAAKHRKEIQAEREAVLSTAREEALAIRQAAQNSTKPAKQGSGKQQSTQEHPSVAVQPEVVARVEVAKAYGPQGPQPVSRPASKPETGRPQGTPKHKK